MTTDQSQTKPSSGTGLLTKQNAVIGGIVLVAAFPLIADVLKISGYGLHLVVLCLIWGLMAASLGLLVGNVGAESFAHGAFFGIGGYTTGYLAIQQGLPVGVGIAVGVLLAALAGLVIALPSLRLSGIYFAIATLVLQLIYEDALLIFSDITNGLNGLSGVIHFSLPGLSTPLSDYYLTMLIVVLCLWFLYRFRNAGMGDVLYMIKQDERLAQHLGYNTMRYKVVATLISTAIAGLAGGLFIQHNSFIGPTSTNVFVSFQVFVYVIVGGATSFFGPVLAAGGLVLVGEVLGLSAVYSQILHALFLFGIILLVPSGLASIDYAEAFDRVRNRVKGK